MKQKLTQLKKDLKSVFDDDLSTRPKEWNFYADVVIIVMIVLGAVSAFLTTFNLSPTFGKCINGFEWFIQVFFTIEVSLRIWAADEIDTKKYGGFGGRVRYCLSFYGLIDFLSVFPVWLGIVFPALLSSETIQIFRVLRIARLFRVFHYMNAFSYLEDAINSKKKEMIVSMEIVVIITVVLSFILYLVEHNSNPEMIANGWRSIVWSFAKYLGDPGKVADLPLTTTAGHAIAFLVGIMGIAIFAFPIGLLSAGFSDAMEAGRKEKETKENLEKIHKAFLRRQDRPTKFQVVPMYVSLSDIKIGFQMTEEEILKAVEAANKKVRKPEKEEGKEKQKGRKKTEEEVWKQEEGFEKQYRLSNVAATIPSALNPQDRIVLEHFECNKPYGYCLDRRSCVTIVSTSSYDDPFVGNFAYYLAKIGGFNYVSREFGNKFATGESYYAPKTKDKYYADFMRDVNELTSCPNAWTVTILAASGALEPEYPEQVHIGFGGKKGESDLNAPGLTINDPEKAELVFSALETRLKDEFGIISERQQRHASSTKRLYLRELEHADSVNSFILRIAWSVFAWNPGHIRIAKEMADVFHSLLDPSNENAPVAWLDKDKKLWPEAAKDLTRKIVGYTVSKESSEKSDDSGV